MIDEIYQGLTDDEKEELLVVDGASRRLEATYREVVSRGIPIRHENFDAIVSGILSIKLERAIREIKKLRGVH